jgi:hypothetical protein
MGVVNTYNPSIWEAEAGQSRVLSQSRLQNKTKKQKTDLDVAVEVFFNVISIHDGLILRRLINLGGADPIS